MVIGNQIKTKRIKTKTLCYSIFSTKMATKNYVDYYENPSQDTKLTEEQKRDLSMQVNCACKKNEWFDKNGAFAVIVNKYNGKALKCCHYCMVLISKRQ